MTGLKLLMIGFLLVVMCQPVTAEASTTDQVVATQRVITIPSRSAKIQVGEQDNPIRFFQTKRPEDRQATVVGLSVLILIGGIASWVRRRFY